MIEVESNQISKPFLETREAAVVKGVLRNKQVSQQQYVQKTCPKNMADGRTSCHGHNQSRDTVLYAEGHQKTREYEIPMKTAGTFQSIIKKVEEEGGLAAGFESERRQSFTGEVPQKTHRARAPSGLRSTCQHSFGQAFTRDQVIAFAKSLAETMGTETRIIEWKKQNAH